MVPEAATTVITEEQAAGIGRPWEQPEFIDKGKLGITTGEGFYTY